MNEVNVMNSPSKATTSNLNDEELAHQALIELQNHDNSNHAALSPKNSKKIGSKIL